MEEEKKKTNYDNNKGRLEIDFGKLLDDDEEPPAEIVVITTAPSPTAAASTDDRPRKQRPQQKQPQEQEHCATVDYARFSDHDLEESITRQSRKLEGLSSKLPDGGAKLRDNIERLKEEQERRKLRRLQKNAEECKKPARSEFIDLNGVPDEVTQDALLSQAPLQSQFASQFVQRLEENEDSCRRDPFDEEFSCLGRCDKRKRKQNGRSSKKGHKKNGFSPKEKKSLLSRQLSFHPVSFYSNTDNQVSLNSDKSVREPLAGCLHALKEKLLCSSSKKDNYQVSHSDGSNAKKGLTVVLVDEEEPQMVGTSPASEEVSPSLMGTTIYYPSREDPESVEIHYSDLQCLAPQAYLTSPIMNFYIQFLQRPSSPTEGTSSDYHFFNTYFYKKLQEAVSYQKNDKEVFFGKFRRWWRGVNIFQKAYILLPIHENLHWSLAIICIPDKEDESGPIILHLDSLGYHFSRSIFVNIRSFLREEWNYVNKDVGPVDIPILDRIWKYLPRRIDEKIITVPQQDNDYDCGLFVLFFMERFIVEAPDRLKKKDLAMFGRRWFKPEEASSLRGKIKRILMDEFRTSMNVKTIWEPVSLCPSYPRQS
ncbi:hypothetical protein Nepgr_003453 [Nepenthes gracilis]|uniref:Ubiquitin-like protease family profile domain-containing protein n=1 Tax=Nepenthes gracilis TaxID=150966 RepID=A0AAD3RZI4_NEPGR|nr:hypothetical protein Nepgr_003453 [Nepenthes gracilis]